MAPRTKPARRSDHLKASRQLPPSLRRTIEEAARYVERERGAEPPKGGR